jgi:hypothetical protein
VRKILLLTVAGLSSLVCSWLGVMSWRWTGAAASSSVLLKAACIVPAIGIVAFAAYLRRPRAGLIAALLILTGCFVSSYFVNIAVCLTRACTTQDSLRLGWQTLEHGRPLWAEALAAFCLMLDYTAPVARGEFAVPKIDQDFRR